jgi:transcriptional regulator with XRE-family HTH domain
MLRIVWRGDELKRLRRAKGLTQEQLAIRLGCGRDEVARWETRPDRWPSAARLIQIAIVLGVDPKALATSEAA